jgi:hypothetical protein
VVDHRCAVQDEDEDDTAEQVDDDDDGQSCIMKKSQFLPSMSP